MSGRPVAAVVLQASGPNALGIIRSLGRAGVPVVACDHRPGALGTMSRYATGHLMADPAGEPERFVADLLALGARMADRPVLFATHDEALATIGPAEAQIEERFRRPWSDWATLRRVLDKGEQQAAARRIGFPVPATVAPGEGDDVVAAAGRLRFPVVLKPRDATGFRRRFRVPVLVARAAGELRARWAEAREFRPQVCEVIPGGDGQLWTLGSYRDAAGRPLGSFTGRKLRQWPPSFGTARAAVAEWDPGLAGRCHALLAELGYHGISQVESKRDPRDGRDYLIEVNARSWLWIGLATACGVNLPHACYLDAIGRPRTWPWGHPSGRRWILSLKHLGASAGELRRGEWTGRELLASLRPPLVDGVIDLRDPRPIAAQLRGYLRRG